MMLMMLIQGTARHWNSDSPADWLLNVAHSRPQGNRFSISFSDVRKFL